MTDTLSAAPADAGDATAATTSATARSAPRRRIRWSKDEEAALIAGVEKVLDDDEVRNNPMAASGTGDVMMYRSWAQILADPDLHFNAQRTNIDLKDKWRVITTRRPKSKGAPPPAALAAMQALLPPAASAEKRRRDPSPPPIAREVVAEPVVQPHVRAASEPAADAPLPDLGIPAIDLDAWLSATSPALAVFPTEQIPDGVLPAEEPFIRTSAGPWTFGPGSAELVAGIVAAASPTLLDDPVFTAADGELFAIDSASAMAVDGTAPSNVMADPALGDRVLDSMHQAQQLRTKAARDAYARLQQFGRARSVPPTPDSPAPPPAHDFFNTRYHPGVATQKFAPPDLLRMFASRNPDATGDDEDGHHHSNAHVVALSELLDATLRLDDWTRDRAMAVLSARAFAGVAKRDHEDPSQAGLPRESDAGMIEHPRDGFGFGGDDDEEEVEAMEQDVEDDVWRQVRQGPTQLLRQIRGERRAAWRAAEAVPVSVGSGSA
ncbi:hypothetical protein GGF32_001753 [Allomyces javanicus]|nr:hypothetical protein GGF32_001753 [Allomyces javanicus]